MIFSTEPKISEIIIDLLADGPLETLKLLKKIKTTKQGFYRALRQLIKEEIITKNKQKVFLSPIWANKIEKFTKKIQKTTTKHGTDTLLKLSEGDTMIFRFKSTVDLYLLWIHYFFIFCQNTTGPITSFNTHNFWPLLRPDMENEMYSWIKQNKKPAYWVIGHNTKLDHATSDYIEKEYNIQTAYEQTPSLKETVFPAVFGGYIMSTIISTTTVEAINKLYQKYKTWSDHTQQELENIIKNMPRSKVIIECNTKKAEQIRKKLLNHFFFYK